MGLKRITYSVYISSSTIYIYPHCFANQIKVLYQANLDKYKLSESDLKFRELINTIVTNILNFTKWIATTRDTI